MVNDPLITRQPEKAEGTHAHAVPVSIESFWDHSSLDSRYLKQPFVDPAKSKVGKKVPIQKL
jgi:hypothetical protein